MFVSILYDDDPESWGGNYSLTDVKRMLVDVNHEALAEVIGDRIDSIKIRAQFPNWGWATIVIKTAEQVEKDHIKALDLKARHFEEARR